MWLRGELMINQVTDLEGGMIGKTVAFKFEKRWHVQQIIDLQTVHSNDKPQWAKMTDGLMIHVLSLYTLTVEREGTVYPLKHSQWEAALDEPGFDDSKIVDFTVVTPSSGILYAKIIPSNKYDNGEIDNIIIRSYNKGREDGLQKIHTKRDTVIELIKR